MGWSREYRQSKSFEGCRRRGGAPLSQTPISGQARRRVAASALPIMVADALSADVGIQCAPQINHTLRPGHGHLDGDVIVEIGGAHNQRARIAIPAIAHDRLYKRGLKRIANVVRKASGGGRLARLREERAAVLLSPNFRAQQRIADTYGAMSEMARGLLGSLEHSTSVYRMCRLQTGLSASGRFC